MPNLFVQTGCVTVFESRQVSFVLAEGDFLGEQAEIICHFQLKNTQSRWDEND